MEDTEKLDLTRGEWACVVEGMEGFWRGEMSLGEFEDEEEETVWVGTDVVEEEAEAVCVSLSSMLEELFA